MLKSDARAGPTRSGKCAALSCVALVGAGTESASVGAATGKKLKSTAGVGLFNQDGALLEIY